MRQQTLAAQTGFEKYGRKSKRERFLEEMEQVVPWAELQALECPVNDCDAGVTQKPALIAKADMIDTTRRLISNNLPVCNAARRIRVTGSAISGTRLSFSCPITVPKRSLQGS